MKFIPTRVHGVLDYVVAIALIFAPYIFMFNEVGGAAVAIPQILGIGLLIYSLLTNYELGVFKVLSFPYHLVIDVIAALFLLLSPFIFGFADEAANVWVPHVAVGVAVLLVVLFSKTEPYVRDTPTKI